jgi:uncharacterized protein YpmB
MLLVKLKKYKHIWLQFKSHKSQTFALISKTSGLSNKCKTNKQLNNSNKFQNYNNLTQYICLVGRNNQIENQIVIEL